MSDKTTNNTQLNWKQYAPFALAIVVMLGAAYKQGVWSERWGSSPDLKLFSEQLAQVPMEFGEWVGEDAAATDEETMKIAGAEGELVRVYRNGSNEAVRVSIICARLQDIFYHTPDRCYPAAGFVMRGEPVREMLGNAEFFTTSFEKSEPTGVHEERGFWSWSGDGSWVAPDSPKLKFAGQQWALYKLYVFAPEPNSRNRSDQRDYSRDFIRDFVPVLETALRPVMVQTGRIKPDQPAETPPAA